MKKNTPLKIKIQQKFMPRYFIQFNPTKIPAVARWIEKKLLEGDDMLVMPRNELVINQRIESAEEVLPTAVVEHFIRKAGYISLINNCLCREALKCKHFPISPGCIYLGEAARHVHPELGRQATVEEALEHVRRSQELGLVSMIGRSKLDCMTHDIGPGDRLMAICNCCPCCCVSRGLAYSHPLMREKFNRIPGVKIVVSDRCEGCGTCTSRKLKTKICIYHANYMENGKAHINPAECRGCGRCVSACPNHAIDVIVEDPDYIQHTIERLERAVDVT